MNPIRRIVLLHKRRLQEAESFLLKKQQELEARRVALEQCRTALEMHHAHAIEQIRAINAKLFGCVVSKTQVDLCNEQLVALSLRRAELEAEVAQARAAIDAATQQVAGARSVYYRQAARTEKYVEFNQRLENEVAFSLLRKEELEFEEIIGVKR